MKSKADIIETGMEMQERNLGQSFLQRHSQGSNVISSQRGGKEGNDDSKISQGEIDDIILKESQKIIEFDDLPKGILKKLLSKINRQSFQDDPNTEIEINDAYSLDDIQTASMSLRDKMRICNEVSPNNYFFEKSTLKGSLNE